MIAAKRCARSCAVLGRAAVSAEATGRASQPRKSSAARSSAVDTASGKAPLSNDNSETFYGAYALENEAVFGQLTAAEAGRRRPAAGNAVGRERKQVARVAAAAAPVAIEAAHGPAAAYRGADRAESSPADSVSGRRLSSADPLGLLLSYPLYAQQAAEVLIPELLADRSLTAARLPSVSAVLDETRSAEDKRRLEDWKARMIAELGADGFQRLQEETLRNGSNLHKNIELWLEGDRARIDVAPAVAGHWQSLMSGSVMQQLSGVLALEHRMEHDQILYRGVVDCVASFRDVPSVVEWKTSKKPKQSLAAAYDYPIQVAAYIGLWNRAQLLSLSPVPQAQPLAPVRQGVLVITYESGEPADVLVMNDSRCSHYWRAWLSRLHAFWTARLLPPAGQPSR